MIPFVSRLLCRKLSGSLKRGAGARRRGLQTLIVVLASTSCGADETLGPQTESAATTARTSTNNSKPQTEASLDLCAAAGMLLQTRGLAETLCARQLPTQPGLTAPGAEAQAACELCARVVNGALSLSKTLSCVGPVDNCNLKQDALLACASKTSERLGERLTGCDYGTPTLSVQQVIQESLLNPTCAVVLITCPAALEELTKLTENGLISGF